MPHDRPAPQPSTPTFGNARIVLESETVLGSLAIRDGRIAAIDQGAALPRGALDCDGDFLCPGLIELHTEGPRVG